MGIIKVIQRWWDSVDKCGNPLCPCHDRAGDLVVIRSPLEDIRLDALAVAARAAVDNGTPYDESRGSYVIDSELFLDLAELTHPEIYKS